MLQATDTGLLMWAENEYVHGMLDSHRAAEQMLSWVGVRVRVGKPGLQALQAGEKPKTTLQNWSVENPLLAHSAPGLPGCCCPHRRLCG